MGCLGLSYSSVHACQSIQTRCICASWCPTVSAMASSPRRAMFFLALSLALLGDDLRRCSGSQVPTTPTHADMLYYISTVVVSCTSVVASKWMTPTLPSGVRGLHGQSAAAGRQGPPSTTTRRAAPPDADGCSRRQVHSRLVNLHSFLHNPS